MANKDFEKKKKITNKTAAWCSKGRCLLAPMPFLVVDYDHKFPWTKMTATTSGPFY